jgi:hypothetical protein
MFRSESSRSVCPLSRLPFCRNGKSGILPRMESALKRPHVVVPAFLKFPHQTDARGFVRSRAVRQYRSGLGDSRKIFFEFVQRQSDRFGQHSVRFRPSGGIANVNPP